MTLPEVGNVYPLNTESSQLIRPLFYFKEQTEPLMVLWKEEMEKIRLLIADDHEMVRTGLRKVLENETDMEVIGEAADGRETVDMIKALGPDVAIIDIAMPQLSGLEAMRTVRESGLDTRTVILSLHKKDAYVHQALLYGAMGYLVKPTQAAVMLEAIRTVNGGDYFLSPQIRSDFIKDFLRRLKEQGRPARPGLAGYRI